MLDLVWGGTRGADSVAFEQVPGTATIRVRDLLLIGNPANQSREYDNVTGRVIAYGNAGDDQLDARGLSTIQATLNGNAGNNTLYGGAAGDILIGGSNGGEGQQGNNTIIAGNGTNTIYGNAVFGRKGVRGGDNLIVGGSGDDTIYGNFGPGGNGGEGGRNVIIGGEGSDIIYASRPGNGGEGGHGSILIAGSTTLALPALQSIRDEWNSAQFYPTRVDAILGNTTTELNGTNSLVPRVTVFDDDQHDVLVGDSQGNFNWFIGNLIDDAISNKKDDERLTDLASGA